jgi:hypothetical protein
VKKRVFGEVFGFLVLDGPERRPPGGLRFRAPRGGGTPVDGLGNRRAGRALPPPLGSVGAGFHTAQWDRSDVRQADWSTKNRKKWMTAAERTPKGWQVAASRLAPEFIGCWLFGGRTVLAGFDFHEAR